MPFSSTACITSHSIIFLSRVDYFLEPASSSKPQFPSVNDVGLRVIKDTSVTLLCPAQAYPVATFR